MSASQRHCAGALPCQVVAASCTLLESAPPFVLRRTQVATAIATQLTSTVLPSGNFHIDQCPDPDDINWPSLWATWGQVLLFAGWVGRGPRLRI